MHKTNTAAVICALILLSTALAQPSNYTQPYSKNPKLESVLSQLISSDNQQDFASVHNLYIRDGNVRVVVELGDETALLPDYVMEETRHNKNVQILVPIKKITELSLEANVTFIRTPLKPYAGTQIAAPAIQTPAPKSGSNSTIPFIISIILIFLARKKRSGSNVKK